MRNKILKSISVVVVLVAMLLLISLPAVEAKPPVTTQDFTITDEYEGSVGPLQCVGYFIGFFSDVSGAIGRRVSVTTIGPGDIWWRMGGNIVTICNRSNFEVAFRIIVTYTIRSAPGDPIYQ